jgi:hypothetical protein|tara:strand:+ start:255 stop:407 length:153 start_codon:yes stop_codon:yes gene_type:complete
MSYIVKTKEAKKLITERSWEWYKKEIQRLKDLDNQITNRVRATYSIKKTK